MPRTVTLLVLMACASPSEGPFDGTERPPSFPRPWLEVEASDRTISGAFYAELDAELAGAGWFESNDLQIQDLSAAHLREVPDASWPVVQVQIAGRDGDGWSTLELDIASNRWVAGSVPFDGEAAIGLLTTVDGELRYVVGGALDVAQAGVAPGQVVQASFTDAVLSEVVP